MKRNRAVSLEHKIARGERVKVSVSRTLAREREIKQEHGDERVDSTVKKGGFQGGKGGQAIRVSLAK